ncbi:MAG: thioredoxin [bacterium]
MAHAQEIISRETLESIMVEGGPAVMIDFWASWCGPCRMMAPHFEAAAQALADEPITFYKLDTEKHPDLAQSFRVMSLPTILLIHDGKVQDVLIGARDTNALKKKGEWLLSKARGEGFFKRIFG